MLAFTKHDECFTDVSSTAMVEVKYDRKTACTIFDSLIESCGNQLLAKDRPISRDREQINSNSGLFSSQCRVFKAKIKIKSPTTTMTINIDGAKCLY
jgi:hypothetical protein